jgi:hypothetical protein
MRNTLLKGAALGMVVGALTLTATAAFAGTGVGAVFNIGTTNAVNASTVQQGSTNDQQLRVVNSNTGSRAYGIGIHTDPSRPPLAVSSHVMVAGLNADLLDGLDSVALQKRVTGQCSNGAAIRQINADGSASCTTNAIIPIHEDILSNQTVLDRFAPASVSVSTDCHVGGGPASFTFHSSAVSGGTLNFMFSVGGATSKVNASGVAMGEDSDFPVTALTTNRIEGQFIWAEAHHVITFTLHFLDRSGRCELTGTAEVAVT